MRRNCRQPVRIGQWVTAALRRYRRGQIIIEMRIARAFDVAGFVRTPSGSGIRQREAAIHYHPLRVVDMQGERVAINKRSIHNHIRPLP